jgi:hypothetical protein
MYTVPVGTVPGVCVVVLLFSLPGIQNRGIVHQSKFYCVHDLIYLFVPSKIATKSDKNVFFLTLFDSRLSVSV